ncbi:hypothetical protein Q4603_08820 [Zobellia galactanivorans]|nr:MULTISPECIES: hypothetical protein [Zobellia]MBU3024989.1 hypothetical protein [Zobellia galactanivorans]MDO6808711.1 hypothetical protein [Zobellia galactanivorans]
MGYLSPQIEVLAKKKKREEKSLVKREYSCGIFQDYGDLSQDTERIKD